MQLLIMAAGMGSRFGGLKQVEPMGPNGEFLIDYSIYDAIKEGFSKVDYDYDVDSSKGNGFEDWIFVQRCIAKIPSKPFETYLPARTRRGFLSDSMSTWDPLDPELKKRNEEASRRKIYDIWAGKI